MDKETAIKISKSYLMKIKDKKINFSEAWLFGSYAKGNYQENSDIDIAIVLSDNSKTFDIEVQLMVLRTGEETLIEPHLFNKDDFRIKSSIVNQIKKTGLQIDL